ncbi:hypothetical protein D3C83_334730 [compost metagenome]
MQQQVAHFLTNRPAVTFAQRMVELERFFHQVWPERGAGLHPVPGTALAQVADHGHGAIEG